MSRTILCTFYMHEYTTVLVHLLVKKKYIIDAFNEITYGLQH